METIKPPKNPGTRLRYLSDTRSGISRKVRGRKSFDYLFRNRAVRQKPILSRIDALALPPAWTNVWISPHANSHLQATGRDARGRKQYRYHDEFREKKDGEKFANLIPFARNLPLIRKRLKRDLRLRGLPREKVLAAIVELLDLTLIRVGNSQYSRENHSYGLSTLQNRHVHKEGASLRLDFKGKSGVKHVVEIGDRKLVQIIKKCHALPGRHLFEYVDHLGKIHAVNSSDVNDYVRMALNADCTAKSFRTWWGTVLAALAFERAQPAKTTKGFITGVVREIALQLRNTPAVCRRYYIHPAILSSVMDGGFMKAMRDVRWRAGRKRSNGFSKDEAAVFGLLRKLERRSSKP